MPNRTSRLPGPLRDRLPRLARRLLPVVLAVGLVAVMASPALAQPAENPFPQIISRLHGVIVGLLVGLATLFLTIGGVRYLFAGGDPSQVEKAKTTLRLAAVGYGIAALSGPLVSLLRYVVGA